MRAVLNTIAAALVCALIAGAWLRERADRQEEAVLDAVRADVLRLSREVRVRAATESTEVNGRGWPVTIDPAWFDKKPPRNALLSHDRPWIEVAPPSEAELEHPVIRVAVDKTVPAFWYNPANGVVRARAPLTVSDKRTTEIYNRINGAGLRCVFEDIAPPRNPRSFAAGEVEDGSEEWDEGESGDPALAEAPVEDYSEAAMDPTRPREDATPPAPASAPR